MVVLNRERDLAEIEDFLASRRSELIIVYGRRGAGKSALLAEALANRPHIYYQATTAAISQQLEDITRAIRAFNPEVILPGTLPSLDAALDALTQISDSKQEPLTVVIDELPYLAEAEPAAPTIIQRWWDNYRRRGAGTLKVFLLGSLVSWMEEQTLSDRGPLHNRRTGQLLVEPLTYLDSALFYPTYAPEDRLAAYAIWGGLPSYLEEIDAESSLWDNVRERVLRPGARLAQEPRWLSFGDLRGDALYASILRALAEGERRPGKIAQAVGRPRADDVGFQLSRLVDLGLVRRVVPITSMDPARSRQSQYLLADHYVAFWYRYVQRLRHLLAMRRYDDALEAVKQDFDKYVSEDAFEDVCRQFLWHAASRNRLPGPLDFDAIGSWWVARQDVQDEVDVVALKDGRTVLVGECKWSRQRCDMRDLQGLDAALLKRAADLKPIDRPWRALFSRSGFTEELIDLAAKPGQRLLLYGPSDLYPLP